MSNTKLLSNPTSFFCKANRWLLYMENLVIQKPWMGINNILLTWRFWCFCFTNWIINAGRKDILLINFLPFLPSGTKVKAIFYYFSRRMVLFLLLICFNLQMNITTTNLYLKIFPPRYCYFFLKIYFFQSLSFL